MNSTDFRIESIRAATVNGRAVRIFKAFRKTGDSFIFAGEFTAPARAAKRDLWKIAAQA